MKAEYVNPFVESVHEFFVTMLGSDVERMEVNLTRPRPVDGEFVALIGLSGIGRGTVALALPLQTALATVSRFTGMEVAKGDTMIPDAVAEIVNIVAGGAKARLYQGGTPIDLGLPSVIYGEEYHVMYPSGTMWLDIPFASELGSFSLRLNFLFDGSN